MCFAAQMCYDVSSMMSLVRQWQNMRMKRPLNVKIYKKKIVILFHDTLNIDCHLKINN